MVRREFGNIRRRQNGRWQARYPDAAGRLHSRQFSSRNDAARFLAGIRADLDRGDWFDPQAGSEGFADYAAHWIESRRVRGRLLAPRTRDLYEGLLDRHIAPAIGHLELRQLTVAHIRDWHARLLRTDGPGAVTTAKCYRLVRAICNTAVAEGRLSRNPCSIPGAGQESSPERPTISINEVYALADAVAPRWRALILLASFCGLRFGELAALTREQLDVLHATVTVSRSVAELPGGVRIVGPPKSEAGRRTVAIPAAILDELTFHLERYTAHGPNSLVFEGPKGGPLRRRNMNRSIWRPATQAVGIPHVHFHDLRHTGNTLAAATGASLRELMARMGHSSAAAALRYQHATRERDAVIAAALSELVMKSRPRELPENAMRFSHQGEGRDD